MGGGRHHTTVFAVFAATSGELRLDIAGEQGGADQRETEQASQQNRHGAKHALIVTPMSRFLAKTVKDMNRRNLLSLPVGLAAASVLSPAQVRAKAGRPKNIIFCVSDGMSPGVLMMAEYLSNISRGKGTRWAAMVNDMHSSRGLQDVASLNSPVTDSSSSSSAWGSGSRIFNAAINYLPDGTKLTPIMHLAKQAGKRTAMVTTATVTHATPAGFAAAQQKRDDEELIAPQYMGQVDFVLGGGQKFYLSSRRKDKRDLAGEYLKAGYQVAQTPAELMAGDKRKPMLGIFSDSHVPYTLDRGTAPTLAEMTGWTLDGLTGASPKGFIMQVEGARVDHAAHNNDIAAQLWEQVAFDDALGVCLDYAAKHDDTLVITTSDHGNSSPGLNGMGVEYADSGKCFERIAKGKKSFEELVKIWGAKPSAARVRELIEAERGIVMTPQESELIAASFAGKKNVVINSIQDKPLGVLGQVLGNYYGVSYTGMTHTSEYPIITAIGPGSLPFEGLVVNTEVFPRLTKYMGIDFKNPKMTPAQAGPFMKG